MMNCEWSWNEKFSSFYILHTYLDGRYPWLSTARHYYLKLQAQPGKGGVFRCMQQKKMNQFHVDSFLFTLPSMSDNRCGDKDWIFVCHFSLIVSMYLGDTNTYFLSIYGSKRWFFAFLLLTSMPMIINLKKSSLCF